MQDFRNQVLASLQHNFSSEQLAMIDCAMRDVGDSYEIKKKIIHLPATNGELNRAEIDGYLIRKRAKGCSLGTIVQYKQVLRAFDLVIQKNFNDVIDSDVIKFLDQYELYRGVGKCRKDGMRKILNGFFRYLSDCGKIKHNPMVTVDKIKVPVRLRHPLASIELAKIRRACATTRELALVDFLFATGCRVSEVTSINKSDIDFENMRIRVIGKGDKERYVFLNTEAIVSLNEYFSERLDGNDALFVSDRRPHGRIKKTAVEKIIRNIGRKAKLNRNIFPHLFRHTMATHLYNHGMRIEDLQVILGHTSADTTQIYAKQDPKLVQQEYHRIVA